MDLNFDNNSFAMHPFLNGLNYWLISAQLLVLCLPSFLLGYSEKEAIRTTMMIMC